jgi:hypothetical protein
MNSICSGLHKEQESVGSLMQLESLSFVLRVFAGNAFGALLCFPFTSNQTLSLQDLPRTL